MNFQLTEEFIESVELLIDQNNNTQLIKKFDNCLAPVIAEILQALDFEKCKYLFSLFNEHVTMMLMLLC